MVKNKNFKQIIPTKLALISLAVISAIYNLPIIFARDLVRIENTDMWILVNSAFSRTTTQAVLNQIVKWIRIVLPLIVLPFINILSAIGFYRYFNKRSMLTKSPANHSALTQNTENSKISFKTS